MWVNSKNNTTFIYLLTYLRTELSPSWEAANCAAIQKIPSNFKEPEGSSPCSQKPSTGPYPEPVRSSSHHPILFLLRSILILSAHLRLGLPSGFFPSGFPTNIIYAFLVSPIPNHFAERTIKDIPQISSWINYVCTVFVIGALTVHVIKILL
jgi:hypothetical protein